MQNGQAWRALNFAIENALQLAEFAANFVRFFTCPEDFTGAVKTACAATITLALFVSYRFKSRFHSTVGTSISHSFFSCVTVC